ncbi:MAG: aminotransferase class III-fold pyridoxal phosphate-dependent enzyme, partial [Ignavibacteria bacterium]|nr:aminotransferase class III-fold pyridoxal phosphate-dependent enzyme [Ignavibacteria bacterium]
LMPGVKHLEFNSLSDLEDNINDDTAGVFVECIQGEGGVNMATDAFITKINELKEKYGFIVVADEIQSGVGRTGKMHGFEHFGLDADIVTLAKGIGGGLPLGAILGNERVKNVFSVGEHGSTFGGNPVAAACGLLIFTELENGLMDKVNRLSEYLFAKLNIMKSKYPEKIKDIRGKGLMIGIELNSPGQLVVEKMMQKEVLVNCTNENVIRLLPPYIIAENDIDLFIDRFSDSV